MRALLPIRVVLARFHRVHGSRYDYDEVHYRGMLKPVTIICAVHGRFRQRAQVHCIGRGCPRCGFIKQGKTFSRNYWRRKARS